jgi:hypothetical protein
MLSWVISNVTGLFGRYRKVPTGLLLCYISVLVRINI